jgi:hypothetical protein
MADGPKRKHRASGPEVGRRIRQEPGIWHALDGLAGDEGRSIDDLAAEAFRDLLRKHRRPQSLIEALRESARQHPANDREPPRARKSS